MNAGSGLVVVDVRICGACPFFTGEVTAACGVGSYFEPPQDPRPIHGVDEWKDPPPGWCPLRQRSLLVQIGGDR